MIDTTIITILAGRGGNGCVSFRREKFVPKGGPDGGDGGDAGSVYLVGDASMNTLLHLKYHSIWKGERGWHGKGKKQRGANGEDMHVPVPVGSLVWRMVGGKKGDLLVDISDEAPVLVARGGGGGKGNARFVSSVNREPVLAERGEEGEKVTLFVELKLLADVGIVGKPNSGKSTLLSRSSGARPKVAPYPFTTVEPVLGAVDVGGKNFVIVEIPGLIEGAHRGVGLGHEFLRHAERVRIIIHLIDGMSEDPMADWTVVNHELGAYSAPLLEKPQITVLNKVDITEVREKAIELVKQFAARGVELSVISAATGEGVPDLLRRVVSALNSLPRESPAVPHGERPAELQPWIPQFTLTRDDGVFVVSAPRLERIVALADLRDRRAMAQVWKEMDRLGVVRALEAQGVTDGDTVRLGSVDLEWY